MGKTKRDAVVYIRTTAKNKKKFARVAKKLNVSLADLFELLVEEKCS